MVLCRPWVPEEVGLVLLHIAVLVLLFGGIYGKSVGVDGMIRLADGENKVLALDVAANKYKPIQPLLRKLKPMEFELSQGAFRIDYDKSIQMAQDIRENVPPALQDYYLYFVKDFVSTLTVSRNGKTVSQEVKVNHPLKIDRLVLYQSGYQQMGYLQLTSMVKRLSSPFPGAMVCRGARWLVEPMGGGADTSSEAFSMEQVKAGDLYIGGQKESYLGPMTVVHRADMTTGQQLDSVILTPDNSIDVTIGGVKGTLTMSKRVDNFSDFSYKRDPGIPILYLGWIAMIIGIALALYVPFSQVWIRVEGQRVQYLISGAAGQPESPLSVRLHDILGTS